MGWQWLASFLFDLSFCISTVLPLVIHRGVFPSRQALRCHTRFFYKLVKFFSQNPWTPSGPGAFKFGILFSIFLSFSYEICARSSLFFLFISFLISFNQVTSLLCSTSWPQIPVQNIFLVHQAFGSCSIMVKPLCYHASDLGSIPHGGHTNRSSYLLALLGQLSLPSFRGW